ncbi:MAG: cytochrome c [Granulosicoccus sp.]|nr:cytochrome c [Granulosicoccus sp.]
MAYCSLLNRKLVLIVAFVLGGIGFVVHAADEGPHDKAIEVRQGMFQLYGFNFGLLNAMAKEKIPYDADLAKEAASNLDSVVNLGQSQLWPEGSDNETPGNAETRALPAMWESFPEVLEKSDALKQASAALNGVAGDGLDALKGAIGDVGASCKGCHDDFRAKKK